MRFWIVDPKDRRVYSYRSPSSVEKFDPEDVLIVKDLLPDLRMPVGDLFENWRTDGSPDAAQRIGHISSEATPDSAGRYPGCRGLRPQRSGIREVPTSSPPARVHPG